jgi:putative mRNA 3-end processing factor
MSEPLLQVNDNGLYCPPGDFYVDPWRPVGRAVITHAHADHARAGCGRYLAALPGARVLRTRLGPEAVIDTLPYGQAVEHNGVRISLHPPGTSRRPNPARPAAAWRDEGGQG